jgi:hypothetical protein
MVAATDVGREGVYCDSLADTRRTRNVNVKNVDNHVLKTMLNLD